MTAQEIATRWAQVQGYTKSLADWRDNDQHDADIAQLRQLFAVSAPQQSCFGFEGSTGRVQGLDKWFQALAGLSEGFRKL
jgi:hypothetical protein